MREYDAALVRADDPLAPKELAAMAQERGWIFEIREENLLENSRNIGNYFMEQLKNMEGIKEVRGMGLMIGIEFENSVKDIRNKLLFEKKIFTGVSGTNTIRLLPPLCLSKADAKSFIEKFKEILNEL